MQYVLGIVFGFCATLLAALIPMSAGATLVTWLQINLGSSAWLFLVTMLLFQFSLVQLQAELNGSADYSTVVFLDQLSDVWMHLFVGIGVVWTAVGMRDALQATLSVPGGLVQDAGQVLGRLVDGGILLALTTTIVGALGGYAMRLVKTVGLGAALSEFFNLYERREIAEIADRLESIQASLNRAPTMKGKPDAV